MSWMDQLGNMLQQYAGAPGDQASPSADNDFDQFAQAAPPDALTEGIAHAFRSDQTPPFAQRVSHLFSQSDRHQRAGLRWGLGVGGWGLEPAGPERQAAPAGH